LEIFSEHTTDFQTGVIIPVNKPVDWTSFDVVNKIRYLLTQLENSHQNNWDLKNNLFFIHLYMSYIVN